MDEMEDMDALMDRVNAKERLPHAGTEDDKPLSDPHHREVIHEAERAIVNAVNAAAERLTGNSGWSAPGATAAVKAEHYRVCLRVARLLKVDLAPWARLAREHGVGWPEVGQPPPVPDGQLRPSAVSTSTTGPAGPPSRRLTRSGSGDHDEPRRADRTHGPHPAPGTTPYTDLTT
jgi:hypothetical protein